MASVLIGLDVGEKRIGVALADDTVRIASPLQTIVVDGTEREVLHALIANRSADTVVVGYPRNQAGEPTAQTRYVEEFIATLGLPSSHVVFQDESLTSVLAEQRLKAQGKPYEKGDIDAYAATIILQDYLETL